MEEIPLDSVRATRARALRAAAFVVASFAALIIGAIAAVAMSGNVHLLPGVAGFLAYILLFGRAVRELDADRLVWDHPDSGLLLRVSGKSLLTGDRP